MLGAKKYSPPSIFTGPGDAATVTREGSSHPEGRVRGEVGVWAMMGSIAPSGAVAFGNVDTSAHIAMMNSNCSMMLATKATNNKPTPLEGRSVNDPSAAWLRRP